MATTALKPGQPLTTKTLFFYGLADVPIMLALIPMSIYLNRFYTGDMGLAISTVANIMLFARLFDVITDPLIGYLSDNTKSRFGRRKVWMLASLPLLMIGIFKIFIPPEGVGALYLFSWLMVMWLGWTMLMIPYYAWAAELSTDYDERTKITGWRSIMGSAGSLIAHAIPAISFGFFAFGGTANYMMLLAVAAMVLIPVCVGLCLMKVPEFPEVKSPHVPMMAGLRMMWQNAPFRRLALGYVLSYMGLAIVMPLYIFFVEFILEANPAKVVWMLIISTSSGMLGVPLWVWISKHIGKHKAWISGLLFVAVANPYFLLLGPGDFWLMAPGIIVIGLGTGAFGTLPNSMKADVIDLDMARSGKNRAAFFFSAWSLVTKLSSALGGWVALQSLAFFGFNALNGAQNTEEALLGLRMTYAVAPIFFYIAAVVVIWKYPITKERQERIRTAIDKRQARREAAANIAE
jgi:GPH family glycoside/pentoside/hexuronide:cation symporter